MTMLDGYSIVDKKIILFDHDFDTQEQIQPNGVDLRAGKIYQVTGKASIPRESRATADFRVVELALKDAYWTFSSRDDCLYYVDFLETITVPEGYCGIIHTRSSLERAGVDVQAGLYDTGFTGRIGGSMRVYNDITIEYGARIAQMTLSKAVFRGQMYTGRYQNTDSQTAIVDA